MIECIGDLTEFGEEAKSLWYFIKRHISDEGLEELKRLYSEKKHLQAEIESTLEMRRYEAERKS